MSKAPGYKDLPAPAPHGMRGRGFFLRKAKNETIKIIIIALDILNFIPNCDKMIVYKYIKEEMDICEG